MTRVLFVCTGNVHRSVLAERLLAARLPPGSSVRAESAGTQAQLRPGMESGTRAVLEKMGADGLGFSARLLTAELVGEASLVLGLAREHREAAVRLAPSALRRCFTLKEFVRLASGGADGPGSRGGPRGGSGPAEVRGAGAGAVGVAGGATLRDGSRIADGVGPAGGKVPWTVRIGVPGGRGRDTVRTGLPGGEVPRAVDGFDAVVAAAAARRGATGPVPPDEDDVADPWAKPHDVLYECAREIDRAVSRLALLLGGGGAGG